MVLFGDRASAAFAEAAPPRPVARLDCYREIRLLAGSLGKADARFGEAAQDFKTSARRVIAGTDLCKAMDAESPDWRTKGGPCQKTCAQMKQVIAISLSFFVQSSETRAEICSASLQHFLCSVEPFLDGVLQIRRNMITFTAKRAGVVAADRGYNILYASLSHLDHARSINVIIHLTAIQGEFFQRRKRVKL